MVSLPSHLNTFFTYKEINFIGDELKNKHRITFHNDQFFIKASRHEDLESFKLIEHEIFVYNYLKNHLDNIPPIIWCFEDSSLSMFIIAYLKDFPLATKRDAYCLKDSVNLKLIIEKINTISNIPIPAKWNFNDNRQEKMERYIFNVQDFLATSIKQKLTSLLKTTPANTKLVFSHGDLLPMNILYSTTEITFIDWEWAGIRSKNYDKTLFLLFSHEPSQIITSYNLIEESILWDTLFISLRELNNLNRLKHLPLFEKNIPKWIKAVSVTLES
ncbi:hypothetical protein JCM19047_462 [Bacillus sp. JCM 19047]|uniref:Phosphotransferase n=1 Tax=Shouchella miscanthi TaxID=2598861 RepID=A0ABU6NNS6_9BACI|nr:phosphotransferase [Shouchella miscanthi]MED4128417.1 phosphotransferase [Shouchella miscanthi]GAF20805.1 hypothetical protein JCM19047_462 [Bacillus sp. JCM 19047]